jgi:hypothetical protein
MSVNDPLAVLQRRLAEISADRSCSYWLRDSVLSAIERDPVDAVRDAEILLEILQAHLICCIDTANAVTTAVPLTPRSGTA